MPRMDGYEFMHQLRHGSSPGGPPVVAMSGLGSTADVERAREAGFDAHLTKPADEAAIVAAVRAGVASIEHMTGVPEAASPNRSALLAAHYRGFFPGWTAFERSWSEVDSAPGRGTTVTMGWAAQ